MTPRVPSTDFILFAAMLRYVAGRTERGDSRIDAMMDLLTMAAAGIEAGGAFHMPADRLELGARAFAGVAAFLQKQILPEAINEGNAAGERQIRWAVDSAMAVVNTLLSGAAAGDGQPVEIRLDPPPDHGQ